MWTLKSKFSNKKDIYIYICIWEVSLYVCHSMCVCVPIMYFGESLSPETVFVWDVCMLIGHVSRAVAVSCGPGSDCLWLTWYLAAKSTVSNSNYLCPHLHLKGKKSFMFYRDIFFLLLELWIFEQLLYLWWSYFYCILSKYLQRILWSNVHV